MNHTVQKSKKGLIVAVVALAMAALLLAGLTLAYLTDKRETLNTLNLGKVSIALYEENFGATTGAQVTKFKDGAGGLQHEYTHVTLNNVMPGQLINKDPVVENLGEGDVYVRIKLLAGEDASGTPIDLEASSGLYKDMGLALNTTLWQKGQDGYYYLQQPLAKNATAALFTPKQATSANETAEIPAGGDYTIMIPTTITNNDLATYVDGINIFVLAEAIQATGFTQDLTTAAPWGNETILDSARL